MKKNYHFNNEFIPMAFLIGYKKYRNPDSLFTDLENVSLVSLKNENIDFTFANYVEIKWRKLIFRFDLSVKKIIL